MIDPHKLKTLKRRLSYLQKRLATRAPTDPQLDWDRAECSALLETVEVLERAPELVRDVDLMLRTVGHIEDRTAREAAYRIGRHVRAIALSK